MKRTIIICILFLSYSFNAQKFAVIENKGSNAVYFDYKNPNSFVSILLNNLSIIPAMVIENNFQGVYTDKMLADYGIQKETMLEFSLNPVLQIYRPISQDTWMLIKTSRSLDAVLDSLNKDYIGLFDIDKSNLEYYWNNTEVGMPVRIYSSNYFDIRDLNALLIEEVDSVKWIHFIKSGTNGKNFISLSLTYNQIAKTDCFSFWKMLNETESKLIVDSYKQQCLDMVNHDDFMIWKRGESSFNGLEVHGATFSDPYCSEISSNSELNPLSSKYFDNFHPLSPTLPEQKINTIVETQNIGTPISFYGYFSGVYINIVKTTQSLPAYLSTYEGDLEYQDLFTLNRDDLEKWWSQTKEGEIVRKTPETAIIWAEVPKTLVAFSYCLKNDGIQYTDINDIYFYVESGPRKESYLQFNFRNSTMSNALLNQNIRDIKVDAETPLNWHKFLNVTTSSMTYGKLKSMLNLINDQTQF